MDIASLLRRTARHFPQRTAVIDGERQTDYATLAGRVGRLANAMLGTGLRPGDRVIDLQHNAQAYIETDLALAIGGLVRVPVNPRLTVGDWTYIAENCGARALVYGSGFAGAAEELRDRIRALAVVIGVDGDGPGEAYEALIARASADAPNRRTAPDDLVSINYSSGTTGRPKGCMRTLANRMASLRDMLVDLFRGGLTEDDVWLHAGPITHASGLFVLPHIAAGACQVVQPRFEPAQAVSLIERHRVTGTVWVPTMIERVIAQDLHAHDLGSLRRVAYAGAPMAPERIEVADRMLGGTMVQFYGLVEAIPPLTVLTQEDHARALAGHHRDRLATVGRSCLGADLTLVDDAGKPVPDGTHGELVVAGDHVMRGYWGMDDATGKALRDGRLWTGDMAWRDESGYITIVERKDDMIITGGYNVYPREVEEVVATDPAVADVAVVGLPDSDWGQAVTAMVVVRSGMSLDLDRLEALCRGRLAPFKKPKRFEVVESIPLTPAGKVNRKALREAARKSAGHA